MFVYQRVQTVVAGNILYKWRTLKPWLNTGGYGLLTWTIYGIIMGKDQPWDNYLKFGWNFGYIWLSYALFIVMCG